MNLIMTYDLYCRHSNADGQKSDQLKMSLKLIFGIWKQDFFFQLIWYGRSEVLKIKRKLKSVQWHNSMKVLQVTS